jgi:hypothetical protein
MTPLEHVSYLVGLLAVGLIVWRAVRGKKKRDASVLYIDELRKSKARRTTMNIGEAPWLNRTR